MAQKRSAEYPPMPMIPGDLRQKTPPFSLAETDKKERPSAYGRALFLSQKFYQKNFFAMLSGIRAPPLTLCTYALADAPLPSARARNAGALYRNSDREF